MQVGTADGRRAGGDFAAGRTIGGAEREPPRWSADDKDRDREAGLLAIELAWTAEVVEDEGQPGEAAGWRVHRDLRPDPQEVRHREDDHVDGDERDDVQVRALDRWERAPFLHEALIMRPSREQNVRRPTLAMKPAPLRPGSG